MKEKGDTDSQKKGKMENNLKMQVYKIDINHLHKSDQSKYVLYIYYIFIPAIRGTFTFNNSVQLPSAALQAMDP